MQRRKLLQIAGERLELLSSEKLSGNTYSLIMEDGSYVDYRDRVCFRDLRHDEYRPIFVANTVRTEVEKKLSNVFFKWWVKESFASKSFITKDEKIILKEGVILDCSYPAQYVILAMIGLRYLWEFPQLIKNWGMFIEHVNADAAIIMSHMFTTSDGKTWEGEFVSSNSNHTWFQNYWKKIAFTKAINHDLSALSSLSPMSESLVFSPMIHIFSPDRSIYKNPSDLSYPYSSKRKKIFNSFDGYVKEQTIYEKDNMEKWLKATYYLNYLGKEGKKNES